MAIIQGATQSFLCERLTATHNFSSHTFMMALYDSSANLGPQTIAYSATGEVAASGYSGGGIALTPTVSTASEAGQYAALVDFADVSWSAAITARGALIYNASASNKSVWVLNFSIDRTSSSLFTVTFPAPNFDSAIIRIT